MSADHFGSHRSEGSGGSTMHEFGPVLEIQLPFLIISSMCDMLLDLINTIAEFEEGQPAEDERQPTE